jgi:hypothetical protein
LRHRAKWSLRELNASGRALTIIPFASSAARAVQRTTYATSNNATERDVRSQEKLAGCVVIVEVVAMTIRL